MTRRDQLVRALGNRELVRVTTRRVEGHARGFVVGVGAGFFLLAIVGNGIWLDGYECYRVSDLVNLESHPYARFVRSALAHREETLGRRPRIDLSSMQTVLLSANRLFPLVTLHLSEVCYIGRVLAVDRRAVTLRGVSPNAEWHAEPSRYNLREVTHVAFGGNYEDALAFVSGAAGA